MKTKIYLMSALVLAGVMLAFNSLTDEKIKVSVVHHENGKVTIMDTVFEASSGYTVEQFLLDQGLDPEKTEIVNTDSFEGKYVAEFSKEIELNSDSHSTKVVNLEVEENNGERIEIKKTVDENGNISVEKRVNGKVVELSADEKKELEKDDNKAIKMRISTPNPDQSTNTEKEQVVEVVEIPDGDEKTFNIKIDGEVLELDGEGNNIMILEQIDDENGDVKVKKVVKKFDTDEMKEVDVEWVQEEMNGKKVFISEETDEEEGIEIKVFIQEEIDEDESEGSEGEPKTMTWQGPDGFEKEVVIVRTKERSEILSPEPIFMSRESEPYTVAIVSKIKDNEGVKEPTGSTFVSDDVKLPIEDLKFYPNPTDGNFRMSFFLPQRGQTSITIYDASGKEVVRKDLGNFQGNWNENIDLTGLDSGTYILNITQNNLRLAEKIIVN